MTDPDPAGEYVRQPAEAGSGPAPRGEPQQESSAACSGAGAGEAAVAALAAAFAERFAAAAGSLLGGPCPARVVCLTPQTYGQFVAGVRSPTCCYALRAVPAGRDGPPAEPSTPAGWIELDREFAFVWIERLLGGPVDHPYLPDRPLTAIERRLLRRVLVLAAESLSAAWPDSDEPSRAEDTRPPKGGTTNTRPRFELAEGWGCRPPVEAADHPAMTIRLEAAVAGQVGMVRVCLPVAVLAGLGVVPAAPTDPNAGPMELRVALPDVTASGEALADLAPGDIIATDTPIDGEVVVRLAGIPKFAARLGTSGAKRAVTLTRKIETADRAHEE